MRPIKLESDNRDWHIYKYILHIYSNGTINYEIKVGSLSFVNMKQPQRICIYQPTMFNKKVHLFDNMIHIVKITRLGPVI